MVLIVFIIIIVCWYFSVLFFFLSYLINGNINEVISSLLVMVKINWYDCMDICLEDFVFIILFNVE